MSRVGQTSGPPRSPAGEPGAGSGVAVGVHDVHKAYGETRALAGVTLEARHGEIHALVGENGSGKSTLVKILSGVLAPDRGTVRVLGAAPAATTPRAFQDLGLATVFQEVLMVDAASVTDNVWLGSDRLFRAQAGPRAKRVAAAELLERLTGHPVDPDAPVETLPLSTRQWVAIARALIREPRILILDESTAALDLEDAGALSRELERLRDAGTCILLVTHRIRELKHLADRATVLRGGRSAATVSSADISERRMLELMKGEKIEEAARETAELLSVHGREQRPLISARGIRLTASSKPFDFELRSSEVVGFAGLDGHGQREAIELLAGLRSPAEGTIVADAGGEGRPYASPHGAARRGIAYVPGDRKREAIFPHRSIAENFALPTYRRDTVAGILRPRLTFRRFAEYVARFAIKLGRQQDRITTLSGGSQQKVVVARWLASEPRALLLNDPTRGVDFETKRDLYRILREVILDDAGVIYLSTEIEELQRVCDRVVVFRNRTIETELLNREATSDRLLAALFGTTEAAVERPLDEQARRPEVNA